MTQAEKIYTNGAGLRPIAKVLEALHYDGPMDAAQYKCHCPAHDDNQESLSVTEGKDGKILIKCFAGCTTEQVVAAAGLTMSDLFANGKAKTKGKGRIIATYDYTDADGTLLYQSVRYEPKDFRQRRPDPKAKGGWAWNLNSVQRVLYRLPELAATPLDQWVFVVEGEKDVDNLRAAGLVATCNVGGAGKWLEQYNTHFAGRLVCILPDNDKPGRDHAKLVAEHLTGVAKRVVVVELDGLPVKGDVSDWLAAGGDADQLTRLAEAAPEYIVEDAPATDAETHNSWPYAVDNGRLVLCRESDGDITKTPIADLYARIVGEIVAEDGEKSFVIEGEGKRGGHFRVELPATHFGDTAKLIGAIEAVSSRDGVRAGMRQHIGPAIKAVTSDVWTERRYNRTGWANGKFLMPGRVTGDIHLSLPDKLAYQITDEAEFEVGLAALPDLIEAAGAPQGAMLLAFHLQAPLARIAGWDNERYGVFIYGRTGKWKTSTAQAYMTLYGPRFADDERLIGLGDGSTANAVVGLAAAAHDMPLLLDNYKPNTGVGQRGIIGLIHRIVEGGDKIRMNRNAELRETKPIHTWPIFTGEDLPMNDPAAMARVLVVPFGDRSNEALTRAQAASEHFCAVGGGWLDWLESDQGRTIAAKHAAKTNELRDEWAAILIARNPNMKNPFRVATNLATNALAWNIALEHPQIGPVIAPYTEAHRRGLKIVAAEMSRYTEQGLEATRYLDALRELLATGRAVLVSGDLAEAARWGAKTPAEVEAQRLHDSVIGWVDGNGGAYLFPEVTRKMVAAALGDDLSGITNNTLYDQLHELGAIRKGKDRATITKKIRGSVYRVLHFTPSALACTDDDETKQG